MEIVSETLDAVGTLLIAWAALAVHHRVLNEHAISSSVMRTMRLEQASGIVGILFVAAGYFLRVLF